MKTTTIGSILLGLGVFVLTVAPCVSAQTIPEMLNGQWFQVNGSMKGYYDYWSDNITGKLNEKWKGYVYSTFDATTSTFTMTACASNSDATHILGHHSRFYLDRFRLCLCQSDTDLGFFCHLP